MTCEVTGLTQTFNPGMCETVISTYGTEQVVVEIIRIKLSKSVYTREIDQRSIYGYIEANYGRAKKYRTKDSKLYGGLFLQKCFIIP